MRISVREISNESGLVHQSATYHKILLELGRRGREAEVEVLLFGLGDLLHLCCLRGLRRCDV